MKKRLIALIMSAFCLASALPSVPAFADGQKVVTLGADLTEEQRTMLLKYFGVYGQSVETLTITNADEREHLGSYIPLEQIGTRTFSCALVNPTTSGGIQVKTANLTYVTSNMIATTLSTSGVVNCEVLAAAPFAVSGTGALTGILMAYETASGETLEEEKKEVATQELVTTTSIATNIGQIEATQIVNETKIQIIENNIVETGDIEIVINEVADEENISLSDEDRQLLVDLMEQISALDYNYEEMSETLQRVESNLDEISSETNSTSTDSVDVYPDETANTEAATLEESPSTEALSEDSILLNTDDSALGSDVLFDATDTSALAETDAPDITGETEPADWNAEAPAEGSGELEITTSDTYSDSEDSTVYAETEESPSEENGLTIDDGGSDAGSTITVADLVLDVNESADGAKELNAGEVYLTIKTGHTELIPGSGSLSLYSVLDGYGTLVESIQMNDPTRVVSEELTDVAELGLLGWTAGKEFRIYLSQPLAQNSSYYVVLSDAAFTSEDSMVSFIGWGDTNADWAFSTLGYGISLNETAEGVAVGNAVTGNIYMDNSTAGYAVIDNISISGISFNISDVAAIDMTEFWTNGAFQITFTQSGQTELHVTYYDSADTMNYIAEATYTLDVK